MSEKPENTVTPYKVDVSIVLVNFNTAVITRNCLNSIVKKTVGISYEIIVVDNASSDISCQIIKNEFPQVRLIKNCKNLGFGAANNIGIKSAVGKYVFLLNTDTVLINNAVKILYGFMETTAADNVWCCGGDLFNPDGTPQVSFGNFPSIFQVIFEFGLHRIFHKFYLKRLAVSCINLEKSARIVDYVCGANMFIRKGLLESFGAFDEEFFMYYEETDLSLRFKRLGYVCYIIPNARIIHLCGASVDESMIPAAKLEMLNISRSIYFKKRYCSIVGCFVLTSYRIRNLLKGFILRNMK